MTDPDTLFQDFAQAEVLARRATWAEPDRSAYREALSHFKRHLSPSLAKDLKPNGRMVAKREGYAGATVDKELAGIQRRVVYGYSSWRDPQHGLIATGYLGPSKPHIPSGIYHRFHLALDATPPQIVAYDVVCSTCGGTGQRPNGTCEDCGGGGFQARGSSVGFAKDPRSGQLRILQQPEDDESKAIFAAFGG